MHFLLSTVVKHVLKFKYGWCNAPLMTDIYNLGPDHIAVDYCGYKIVLKHNNSNNKNIFFCYRYTTV